VVVVDLPLARALALVDAATPGVSLGSDA
jgi:hypothetical protein